MRFRTHNIGIVSDINKNKEFLQVWFQQYQRDATRFLRLKDCKHTTTEKENIQKYRFCRAPFEIISSPFILGATIEKYLETYHSDIAETFKNDIYVDNVNTGAMDTGDAIALYKT